MKRGFTLIEILVVITIVGILSTVSVIAYNSVRQNAINTALKSDLANSAKKLDIVYAQTRAYPTTLPSDIKASPGVFLSLVNASVHYSGLTNVQNGVLLSQICQDLVNEGLGSGLNMGGGTDNYITGCGNWNSNSMQVTGWTSKVFNTPIADNVFTNYANSVPPGDAWHPNQQPVIQNFYRQLHDRLIAQGGSFPVMSFWDSWATPQNGGVVKQELPPSDNFTTPTYCLQATYGSGSSVWHVRPGSAATTGPC